MTSPVTPDVGSAAGVDVKLARRLSKPGQKIYHVGVVSRYLVNLINVTVNVFDHHCQTCVSECHSDDEFCIGQEDRLFNEADVLHEKL